MGVHLETLPLEYQVLLSISANQEAWQRHHRVLQTLLMCADETLRKFSIFKNVFVFFCLPGSPPAAVRRRGGDEALRQSHRQRQPAHLPAQQEILREIERKEKEQRATDTEMKQNLGAALPPALTAPLISAYANFCALFLLFCFF